MGGCDGCLNLKNLDNNGLQSIYAAINDIYDNEGYSSTGMSRADFVALAGTVAIRHASSLQDCTTLGLTPNCEKPVPPITLKYGRKDCLSSPNTTDIEGFPNPHGNLTEVLDVFQINMNMTKRDVVALIGAHTLGNAGIRRSGFRGPWVPREDVFDNDFYIQLQDPDNNWFQEEILDIKSPLYPTPRYQWSLHQNGINLLMLNTDVVR